MMAQAALWSTQSNIADPETIGRNVYIGSFSIVEPGVCIKDGCFIGSFTKIRPGAKLYERVEVRDHCFIAPEVEIGADSHIFQFSNIGMGTVIEEKVWVGVRVTVTNTKHIAHFRGYPTRICPVHIKYGVRIGSDVTILPGVTIDENSMVAAGSLVAHDVPSGVVVKGRPAQVCGRVNSEPI